MFVFVCIVVECISLGLALERDSFVDLITFRGIIIEKQFRCVEDR
jgi:hypothetical protein